VELHRLPEAPLWDLTKRVMELRPLHEAPPWTLTKRFMELRPLHEAPPWDLTKRFMELRPNHTITMSHQPIIDLSCIPISCQYSTNHPIMFHMHTHTQLINSSSSIPAHKPFNTCIFTQFMLSQNNSIKHVTINHKQRRKQHLSMSLSSSRLG